MSKPKIYFIISFALFLTAAILLIAGSGILEISLMRDTYIPLGTLITWVGFIALPTAIYFSSSSLYNPQIGLHKMFSMLFKLLILSGVLWGGITFYLADNWAANFSNQSEFKGSLEASKIFWVINYVLFISPLVLIIIVILINKFKKAQ